MKLKPIEYIWLCQEHYDEKCKELGYEIPITLLRNLFGWKCNKCDKDGVNYIYLRRKMVIEKWD